MTALDGTPPRAGVSPAAAAIVAEVADRLADPDQVVARVAGPDGRPDSWHPLSLFEGYPAVALLYAELGHLDAGYRRVAHEYLSRAAVAAPAWPGAGLYAGDVALAFAALCAAHRPGDYAGLLATLDARITAWVPARLRPEWERIDAGRTGTSFDSYDVVNGMAGVGRYLLARGREVRPALVAVLEYLTALTAPPTRGGTVPGWWVTHPPNLLQPPEPGYEGHVNLGLAHGVPGPLALLALAWQAGVRVPGQDDAIARVAEWLLAWRDTDEAGPYWPDCLPRRAFAERPAPLPRTRTAWCYGVPGVARALQLAGRALHRPDWSAVAVDAVRGMLARPEDPYLTDPGLCHGWAGVLHLTRLVGMDAAAPQLGEAAGRMVARVVERYDPAAPFCFRATTPPTGEVLDLAGFLEGAAGVALGLQAAVAGGRTASGWDAALLAG